MEPLFNRRRVEWWRQFIARRKRSRRRWVRDYWTRVDRKIPWPDDA
jgi:hypothetical protein